MFQEQCAGKPPGGGGASRGALRRAWKCTRPRPERAMKESCNSFSCKLLRCQAKTFREASRPSAPALATASAPAPAAPRCVCITPRTASSPRRSKAVRRRRGSAPPDEERTATMRRPPVGESRCLRGSARWQRQNPRGHRQAGCTGGPAAVCNLPGAGLELNRPRRAPEDRAGRTCAAPDRGRGEPLPRCAPGIPPRDRGRRGR